MEQMKNRKAKIMIDEVNNEPLYSVEMYEDDTLVEVRTLHGKSRYYAEDCAENWETGIIK